MRIKKRDPATLFAKASLQPGDVLLSLDETPVASVSAFRKLLRHRLAVFKHLTFEVHRAGKPLSISVLNKG